MDPKILELRRLVVLEAIWSDETWRKAVTEALPVIEEGLRERLSAAEESNRELVRRAQQAESERDQWKTEHGSAMRRWKAEKDNAETWRKRVEAAADELADIGAGECGRLDIVTRVRMLKSRCAALSAAGQVLSAPPDLLGAWGSPASVSTALKASGHGAAIGIAKNHTLDGDPRTFGDVEPPMRYPCSPTCTHDDAATPGHPERVKERSEAVTRILNPDAESGIDEPLPEGPLEVVTTRRPATEHEQTAYQVGFDEGAEAMRAACWEAVQQAAIAMGLSNGQQLAFKSAIEGAAP